MTTRPQDHRCPVCRVLIKPPHLMCGAHWLMVPLRDRTKILRLFETERGSDAHRRACYAAVYTVVNLVRPAPAYARKDAP